FAFLAYTKLSPRSVSLYVDTEGNAIHLSWWLGILLLSYMATSLYVSVCLSCLWDSTHLCGPAFTVANAIGSFFLGGLGLIGAFSALLFWRFLTLIRIPAPLNLVLSVNASVFVGLIA